MDTSLLQRFAQLVTAHTGLQIRAEDMGKLRHTIQSRMTGQQLINPEAYYQMLASDTTASRGEWEELVLPLTIGESYFFRDNGQISLLRQRLIPELIERNSATRSLRIWSAGCSTGEEPYSLAILVHELLPTHHDWHIVIVGTDVNKHAIAASRRGIYREHSLRTLGQDLRKRYFHQHRSDWELDARFRSMVSFRQVNLLGDPFPDSTGNLLEMDLILCRNVLIYFDRTAIAPVITKFTNTLNVGGYLVTGHAELHDQKPSGLAVKTFPESIVYCRDQPSIGVSPTKPLQAQTGGATAILPPSVLHAQRSPIQSPSVDQPRTSAFASAKGSRTTTSLTPDEASKGQLTSVEELYRQACRDADVGDYEAAIRACQLALIRDSLDEKPYHLLAQVAEMQGNLTGAKEYLKKMLYVVPTSVVAHLDLAALYAKERDRARACKMYMRAIELLQALPPNAVLEPFVDLPASKLLPEVQRRLEQLGAPSYALA
jgi:chemotaxis protein methyltransferase CheR